MHGLPAPHLITALYQRLSKDDEQQGESNSIKNQKRILTDYATRAGFTHLRDYTDDGCSGVSFERPGFQALLQDIEAGKVGAVIVKDMSRLGRNYLQVGFYTEIFFPQKNVRFIAVNDNVDSATESFDSDFTPLRNMFNEWMVRDTSKKIRAVKRAKAMSGKPVTSRPVYGYLIGRDDRFEIDEEAAPVVKQIYALCLSGLGPSQIAARLTAQKIPTPGTLAFQRTGNRRYYREGYPYQWAVNTVAHILENREYTGVLVNFKTRTQSYKLRKVIVNDDTERMIVENAHEPIIDRESWERVQELRSRRKRPTKYGHTGFFSGLLFCRDCGFPLYYQESPRDAARGGHYVCGSYRRRIRHCSAHYIRNDVLLEQVTEELRALTAFAAQKETLLVQQLQSGQEILGRKKVAALKRQSEKIKKRTEVLNELIKHLYEDHVTGRIRDERYAALFDAYETEQAQLNGEAARVEKALAQSEDAGENIARFMEIVRRNLGFRVLTPTVLREFVSRIVVHERTMEGPVRHQQTDIVYSFIGEFRLTDAARE